MKKTFTVIVVLICSLGALITFTWAQQKTTGSEGDVGRFQLFQGHYYIDAWSEGEYQHVEAKAVFKIDTKTGYVWEYYETLKNGKLDRGFRTVE